MSGLTREEKGELARFLDSLPGMPRRVLFTGSRTWEDEIAVFHVLYAIEQAVEYASWPMTLVHGAYPWGLDNMASRMVYGRPRPWIEEPHPADWPRFGRAAGPIRNQLMVNLGADACFGFRLQSSRGTTDCLTKARIAGIPTWEVNR